MFQNNIFLQVCSFLSLLIAMSFLAYSFTKESERDLGDMTTIIRIVIVIVILGTLRGSF